MPLRIRLLCLATLLGTLGLTLTACKQETSYPADEPFYHLAKAYLDNILRMWPTQATYLGDHKYDGQLEDLSPSGIEAMIASYKKHKVAFDQVQYESLSPSAHIDYDLIRHDIDSSLFSLTRLKQHTWDPNLYNENLGFSVLFLTILDDDSPQWPERLQSLLSRLRQIPHFLEIAKQNLVNSSPTLIDFTIEQNAGNISFFQAALPPLFTRAPEITTQLQEETDRAVGAMESYGRWLQEELLPRASGDWRLGKELWTEKLRYSLSSRLTPDEIRTRADESLKRTRREMLEIAEPMHADLFPKHRHSQKGDERINVIVKEVVDHVSGNHSTPESLFDDVRNYVTKIKGFIREREIITLPPDNDNLVIEPTPGFLNGLAVAFFNPPPALEPDLKKSFWISSVPSTGDPEKDRERQESYLREYNHYGLQSLTIHEAFPGHYVQDHITQNSPLATVYKKVFNSGTFIEGWAVLMEKIMYDQGYAEGDPANLLIHKKISLRVPMNAILDAQLHAGDMTDEEADAWALDLMMRYGFQEEAEAIGKLRRAKVTSTQLSSYFVGFMELQDVYREVSQKMGDRFVLRDFCDRLPSYGALPPHMVRQQILSDLEL
ncbi:MAG: DUF885 domain-containing protein [Acidobacteriota bacterium]|nr:DUF885 domain-containing protein [Acidobacteriota bacterium]